MSYVLYCIVDIDSVSVFTVQIDDTSDKTEVSATASVWLILCASRVCIGAVDVLGLEDSMVCAWP